MWLTNAFNFVSSSGVSEKKRALGKMLEYFLFCIPAWKTNNNVQWPTDMGLDGGSGGSERNSVYIGVTNPVNIPRGFVSSVITRNWKSTLSESRDRQKLKILVQ